MTAGELANMLLYHISKGNIDADSEIFIRMGAYAAPVNHAYPVERVGQDCRVPDIHLAKDSSSKLTELPLPNEI